MPCSRITTRRKGVFLVPWRIQAHRAPWLLYLPSLAPTQTQHLLFLPSATVICIATLYHRYQNFPQISQVVSWLSAFIQCLSINHHSIQLTMHACLSLLKSKPHYMQCLSDKHASDCSLLAKQLLKVSSVTF